MKGATPRICLSRIGTRVCVASGMARFCHRFPVQRPRTSVPLRCGRSPGPLRRGHLRRAACDVYFFMTENCKNSWACPFSPTHWKQSRWLLKVRFEPNSGSKPTLNLNSLGLGSASPFILPRHTCPKFVTPGWISISRILDFSGLQQLQMWQGILHRSHNAGCTWSWLYCCFHEIYNYAEDTKKLGCQFSMNGLFVVVLGFVVSFVFVVPWPPLMMTNWKHLPWPQSCKMFRPCGGELTFAEHEVRRSHGLSICHVCAWHFRHGLRPVHSL